MGVVITHFSAFFLLACVFACVLLLFYGNGDKIQSHECSTCTLLQNLIPSLHCVSVVNAHVFLFYTYALSLLFQSIMKKYYNKSKTLRSRIINSR